VDAVQAMLIDELGLRRGDVVALVGGGGKTSAMLQLGDEARARGWPVILGTTTKVGVAQIADPGTFRHGGIVDDKFTGANPDAFDARGDGVVVVEADGARGRPAKAPADHEPVIPATSTVVVCVIGADALGRVIADQCHRPLRVAAVVGCEPYERLTPERAARLLTSDRGGRKSVPGSARFVVVITKVSPANADLVAELIGGLTGVDVVTVAAWEGPPDSAGGRPRA
jgi:hypothetical protein